MEKLTNPEYIFCEHPIKDNSFNDLRSFIYCSKYLSLIEIFALEQITVAFPKKQFQKTFFHKNEEFLLVFTQNNVALINEQENDIVSITKNSTLKTENDIMNEAWNYYKYYLEWEDNRLL